jgi:hypothetical protein
MTWSLIALLVFSSLSFAITAQWSHVQQRENETQTVVADGEPLKSNEELKLNEEPELQDLNETTENEESQLPTGFEYPPNFEIGKVRTVGVAIYSDSSISNPLSSINWGNLQPGVNATIECYIHNTGETATVLTLETANWNPPEATTYIALTWDYQDETVNVDEVIPVTLILMISENIQEITHFFFDIIIVGSGI